MTEPTPNERDIDDARILIDAIREGLSASDIKELVTLQEWTVAGRRMTGTPVERLEAAADLLRERVEDRGHAMVDLKQCIRECAEAGIPKRRIAQLARVSPQTVYDALGEGQP